MADARLSVAFSVLLWVQAMGLVVPGVEESSPAAAMGFGSWVQDKWESTKQWTTENVIDPVTKGTGWAEPIKQGIEWVAGCSGPQCSTPQPNVISRTVGQVTDYVAPTPPVVPPHVDRSTGNPVVPQTPTLTPQQVCAQAGNVWMHGGCWERASVQACQSQGGSVSADGSCQVTPQVQCSMGGGVFIGGDCWSSRQDYDLTQCANKGGYFKGGRCLTGAQAEQASCQDSGGLWRDNQCWANQEAYDAAQCYNSGMQWYRSRCMDPLEAFILKCGDDGGFYSDELEDCLFLKDVKDACHEAGFLWSGRESLCYAYSNTHVPRGLESLFLVARSAEEDALLGEYQDRVNRILSYKDETVGGSVRVQLEDLDAFFLGEVAELDGFIPDIVFQDDLAQYNIALAELRQIRDFLEARITKNLYYKGSAPAGPLGALKALAGQGDYFQEPRISFPSGFPTPKETADGQAWAVVVPIEIIFPSVTYEHAFVEFEGISLEYGFSGDGGSTYEWRDIPLDLHGGGQRGVTKTIARLKAEIPKTASNHELVILAGLHFEEQYQFRPSGRTYIVEGYREADALERTFYATSNPVSRSSTAPTTMSASGSAVQDSSGDEETGGSPGGPAAAYNWYETQASKAAAKASTVDRATGWGLSTLMKIAPYALIGLAAFSLYRLGVLDFIGPVKRFRGRKTKADDAGLGDLDLGDLGGI